jgi:hypothetical protein
MPASPNRLNRSQWLGSKTVTQSTPEPMPDGFSNRSRGPGPWAIAAGIVCLLHVLVLAVLAVFYGVEFSRGEGNPTTVLMSGVLILIVAALIAVLARVWFVGSRRAGVPTLLWNGLLIPVVAALYGAEQTAIATGLMLIVVLGLVTTVAALTIHPADG